MTIKFDRPSNFAYNADLKTLEDGLNSIMDYLEAEASKVATKAVKTTVKRKAKS